jgi:hypothetical protein
MKNMIITSKYVVICIKKLQSSCNFACITCHSPAPHSGWLRNCIGRGPGCWGSMQITKKILYATLNCPRIYLLVIL